MVDEHAQRVEPEPPLEGGFAFSFSEWDPTKVASTSMTSGCSALICPSGAWSPANPHTVAPAAARAMSIAFSAASTSPASTSMVLETVGSEATRP